MRRCVSCLGRRWGWLIALAFGTLSSAAEPPPTKPPLPAARDLMALERGCFEDFDDQRYPSAKEIQDLLISPPGESRQITPVPAYDRSLIHRVSGLMQLTVPWPAEKGLRLSVLEPNQLQIHVWHGARGVTLRYYPDFHQCWAAYATTRESGKRRPSTHVLLATSEDRYRRTGLGTVELRQYEGNLLLVRGAVELLRVPMPGPTPEVFLEGTMLLRGLAVTPCTWAGTPSATGLPTTVLKSVQPAELAWSEAVGEGVALKKMADGRIELAAAAKGQPAQTSVALDQPGLYEIIFEIEDAEPGTGFFLGDRQGRHLARLGFFRHRETGKTTFELLPVWANDTEKSCDVSRQVVPFCGQRHWFRLTYGAGAAKCFTSGDGVRWSQPAPIAMGADGACSQVGLYCLPSDKSRSIKLRSIQVRPLRLVMAVASEDLRRRVPTQAKIDSPDAWTQQVIASRPPDVSLIDWFRASAVEYLIAAPKGPVAQAVLGRLTESVAREPRGLNEGLKFFEEAALLTGTDDWAAVDRWEGYARDLGCEVAIEGYPAPFTAISGAMMRMPYWHQRRLPAYDPALLRHELFVRAERERWGELHDFCGQLRYYNAAARVSNQALWDHVTEHLIRWAEGLAALNQPAGKGKPIKAGQGTLMARHPLIEWMSKDAYNTAAELAAAIDGESYREACQLITGLRTPGSLGMLGDTGDSRLLVSAPLAIELALRNRPGLQQTMQREFAALGRLRLERAAATGDAAAIDAVALQFAGTETSGEAHRWLGDRAISGGNFVTAVGHYRRALATAPMAEQTDVLPRLRLAGALIGQDLGRSVQSPVRFGGQTYTPTEFEQLAQQLRLTHQPAGGVQPAAPVASLSPGRYQAKPWATIEAREVKRPEGLPERGLDWAGRQTSVTIAGKQMFVNNRIEQMAFELESGKLKWLNRVAVRDSQRQMPLVAMTPVIAGSRMFVRRLSQDGPELVCLETTDGKVVWQAKPDSYVASDPLFVGPDLYVLTVALEAQRARLFLLALSPGSGRTRMRTQLAEFRDVWNGQIPCHAVAFEDRILAVAGGCVVLCDASGQVHWIRRQIWVPSPSQDYNVAREWLRQIQQRPMVFDGRVYATQPGVFGVECMEIESGRLVWRKPAGRLVRLVGRTPGRIIVEMSDSLVALDATSGRMVWRHQADECMDSMVCDPPDMIAYVQTAAAKKGGGPAQVVLNWLDSRTGRLAATSELQIPARPDPLFKPLVLSGGRQWGLFGVPQDAGQRQVVEITRVGEAERPMDGDARLILGSGTPRIR